MSPTSGPDPPARPGEPWDRRDVERWLVTPMRLLREEAIVAMPGNVLEPADHNRQSAHFDIVAFARTVLGQGTPELLAVVTWARIVAAGGRPDASIAEWCREMGDGWSRRTFYRRLERGLDRIVEAKNLADGRVGDTSRSAA